MASKRILKEPKDLQKDPPMKELKDLQKDPPTSCSAVLETMKSLGSALHPRKRNQEKGEPEEKRKEEDGEPKQAPSKRHKQNPFKASPSSYDRDLFCTTQPFIKVVFSDQARPSREDIVADGKQMEEDALKEVISGISSSYISASNCLCRTCKSASSEMGGRAIHLSLAQSFWHITRPRREYVLSIDDILQGCKGEVTVEDLEEPEDIQFEIGEDAHELEGRQSDDSIDISRCEGDEGESDENGKSKFDIKFEVYDNRIKGLEKNVVILMVECKWESPSVDAIYQVAAYGCNAIKKNMDKGRFSPLYLEVWAKKTWRYAVLFPKGVIGIKDGKVEEVHSSSTLKKSLMTSLKDGKKFLSHKFPGVPYPDGEYVEGVLYISKREHQLPDPLARGGLMTSGVKLFYQSKVRMIVGDKALSWTVDDVKSVLKVRSEEVANAKDLALHKK